MKGDLTLVIDRRDTVVRLDGGALRIETPDAAPQRVPLGVLGLVVVYGSPLISCDVWRALAECDVPAVLQPARGAGRSAHLGTGLGATVVLRCAQHEAAGDAGRRIDIARVLIAAKLDAQMQLLMSAAQFAPSWSLPDPAPVVATVRANRDALARAGSVAAVMGLEGASAAAWYAWLARLLPSHWRFAGRNRRPPRDPANALLSLGYTLLGTEMARRIQLDGLDPAVGFVHGIVPGRESLVLDLIEPLRPGVDACVLALLHDGLTVGDFTYSERDGCRLNKDGRAAFYRIWSMLRDDWPDLLAMGNAVPEAREEAAEEKATGATVSAVADGIALAPLPGQCRRVAGLLRGLLGDPATPAVATETEQD